jgi:hypothetical protein
MNRYAIVVATFLMGFSGSGIFAASPVPLTVLNLQLTCDAEQCRTALLEIRENTGMEASHIIYVFAAPPGITFDETRTTGVEVEGDGDTHYVLASNAGAKWLKCEWLAKARPGGESGRAKGYCWIAIKK